MLDQALRTEVDAYIAAFADKQYQAKPPRMSQQYQRTCADCGYTWGVPRYFARRHGISNFLFGQGGGGFKSGLAGRAGGPAIDQAELNRVIQSSAQMDERAESFRECPKCGSEQYSQRPVRS